MKHLKDKGLKMVIKTGKEYSSKGGNIKILGKNKDNIIVGMIEDGRILFFMNDGTCLSNSYYNLQKLVEPAKIRFIPLLNTNKEDNSLKGIWSRIRDQIEELVPNSEALKLMLLSAVIGWAIAESWLWAANHVHIIIN